MLPAYAQPSPLSSATVRFSHAHYAQMSSRLLTPVHIRQQPLAHPQPSATCLCASQPDALNTFAFSSLFYSWTLTHPTQILPHLYPSQPVYPTCIFSSTCSHFPDLLYQHLPDTSRPLPAPALQHQVYQ